MLIIGCILFSMGVIRVWVFACILFWSMFSNGRNDAQTFGASPVLSLDTSHDADSQLTSFGETNRPAHSILPSAPYGLAIDAGGNLFVADQSRPAIWKVTPDRRVTALAMDDPGAEGSNGFQLWRPRGAALDRAGNLFVTDNLKSVLLKISPGGAVTILAGSPGKRGSTDGPGTKAEFAGLTGVAVDHAGNVFVADTRNHTIRKLSFTGVVSTLAGRAGEIGRVDGPGFESRFNYPMGVAVDQAGYVFVADGANHTVRKITPSGQVSTLAGRAKVEGSADGSRVDARFNHPCGVAVDHHGNVYVAEPRNRTVRTITPSGEVMTLAGSAGKPGKTDGTGNQARFLMLWGIAVDPSGNLYVSDTCNRSIRRITSEGVVTTYCSF